MEVWSISNEPPLVMAIHERIQLSHTADWTDQLTKKIWWKRSCLKFLQVEAVDQVLAGIIDMEIPTKHYKILEVKVTTKLV